MIICLEVMTTIITSLRNIPLIYPIVDTYAWILMPNHFHFLIKIKSEKDLVVFFEEKLSLSPSQNFPTLISQQLSNFFNAYSKAYNKMYSRRGKLFLQSCQSKEVKSEEYMIRVIHYIHYNSIHHGFTKTADEWKYSSYQTVISSGSTQLKREEILQLFQGREGFKKFHSLPFDYKIALNMDF
jgi:REP element-mobilizing transposase RayT